MKTHLHQLFSGMVIAVRKLVFTSLRIIHEMNFCHLFVQPDAHVHPAVVLPDVKVEILVLYPVI